MLVPWIVSPDERIRLRIKVQVVNARDKALNARELYGFMPLNALDKILQRYGVEPKSETDFAELLPVRPDFFGSLPEYSSCAFASAQRLKACGIRIMTKHTFAERPTPSSPTEPY